MQCGLSPPDLKNLLALGDQIRANSDTYEGFAALMEDLNKKKTTGTTDYKSINASLETVVAKLPQTAPPQQQVQQKQQQQQQQKQQPAEELKAPEEQPESQPGGGYKQKQEPVIDADGFHSVPRKGKGKGA